MRADLRSIVLLITLLPAWLGITGRLSSVRERAFFAPALALLASIAYLTLIGSQEIRYDAWLILLCGWAILPALGKVLPADWRALRANVSTLVAGGLLAVLFVFPLLNRGVQGMFDFANAMNQEKGFYQTAARWAAQCGSEPVATDAPGTIAFLTGRRVVDLSGFVSLSAFRVRRMGDITTGWMQSEVEGHSVSTAVVFQPVIQAQAVTIWSWIGGWRLADCPQCQGVEIFAVRDDPAVAACTNSFIGNLPMDEILPMPAEGNGP